MPSIDALTLGTRLCLETLIISRLMNADDAVCIAPAHRTAALSELMRLQDHCRPNRPSNIDRPVCAAVQCEEGNSIILSLHRCEGPRPSLRWFDRHRSIRLSARRRRTQP